MEAQGLKWGGIEMQSGGVCDMGQRGEAKGEMTGNKASKVDREDRAFQATKRLDLLSCCQQELLEGQGQWE